MTKELEQLIDAIIADGVITEKERSVLHEMAKSEGLSIDYIDVLVDGKLDQLVAERNRPVQTPPPPVPPVMSKPSGSTPPPISKVSQAETRKNQTHGVVKKCPNCGETIEAGTMKCKACGHAFQGVEANSSVKKLYQLLNSTTSNKQSCRIIEGFPVPSTKDDLIEFIFFTKSKSRSRIGNDEATEALSMTYRKKYYECIEKAEFYFKDDPQFAPIFEDHKKYKRQFFRNMSTVGKVLFGFIGFLFFLFLLIVILS